MANVAELIRAYEGRTNFASAQTNADDDASVAWAAVRAIVAGESAAGITLADKLYFRADPSASLMIVELDRRGRALGVEVTS